MKEAELIAIRRQLHQIPELALQEKETHAFLLKNHPSFPQTFLTIRTLPKLNRHSSQVTGSDPQRTIGYRADMDALPVTEATGLPFASHHLGIAHACGHDMHMTVALGILSYFAVHQPKDHLIFFFQPAEESKNGGKLAYDMGLSPVSGRLMNFMACMIGLTCLLVRLARGSERFLPAPLRLTLI